MNDVGSVSFRTPIATWFYFDSRKQKAFWRSSDRDRTSGCPTSDRSATSYQGALAV